LQECISGLYVRADTYVFRIDPGDAQTLEFYADRFGSLLANAPIVLSATTGMMGGSGGGPSVLPSPRPAAAIPDIGKPDGVIDFPASVITDGAGYATARISASAEGPGAPRGYIPHQLYGIAYQLAAQPDSYVSNPLNYVSILAFTGKQVPNVPTWYRDIQPLFTQYGNLYPIMSRYVVDLRDYEAVVNRAPILKLAFGLPIADPNHMPVTRDLSSGDRATILKWLDMRGADGRPPLGTPEQSPLVTSPESVDRLAADSAVELLPGQSAGKTAVLLQLEQRDKSVLSGEGGKK
jgi:hypothetical protein